MSSTENLLFPQNIMDALGSSTGLLVLTGENMETVRTEMLKHVAESPKRKVAYVGDWSYDFYDLIVAYPNIQPWELVEIGWGEGGLQETLVEMKAKFKKYDVYFLEAIEIWDVLSEPIVSLAKEALVIITPPLQEADNSSLEAFASSLKFRVHGMTPFLGIVLTTNTSVRPVRPELNNLIEAAITFSYEAIEEFDSYRLYTLRYPFLKTYRWEDAAQKKFPTLFNHKEVSPAFVDMLSDDLKDQLSDRDFVDMESLVRDIPTLGVDIWPYVGTSIYHTVSASDVMEGIDMTASDTCALDRTLIVPAHSSDFNAFKATQEVPQIAEVTGSRITSGIVQHSYAHFYQRDLYDETKMLGRIREVIRNMENYDH